LAADWLAPAAGDEALEQAGEDVGPADGKQLAVGPDGVAVLVGQGLGHGGALGVADHGDGQGAGQQGDQVVPADRRDDEPGRGALDPADDLDPVAGQPEQGDHGDAGQDHGQGRRQGGGQAPGREQHGQAAQPDRRRPGVGVVQPGQQVAELGEEVAVALGHAQQLGDLADDDGQPQPEHEPGLDPGRDEAGHKPHVEQPEQGQHQPDEDGQGGRQGPEAGHVAGGHGRDQGGGDGGGRGGRADDQLARGPEQGVAEQPGEGGEQAGLRGQVGDLGVGDRLGHDQGPGGQGGHHVAPQPGPPVVGQPVKGGDQPGQPARPRVGRGHQGPATTRAVGRGIR